jgi:hypothetical protein
MADSIKDIEDKLKKLRKALDDTGKAALDRVIDQLKKGKAGLDEWVFQLDIFQTKVDAIADSLDYVASSFLQSVNELSRQNRYLTESRNIISNIARKAKDVLEVRKGETSIDAKSVKLAKDKIASQRRQLENLKLQFKTNTLQRKEIQSIIDALPEYEKGLEGVLATDKAINKQLGITPQLIAGIDKALSKIGLPSLGINEALDKTRRLGQAAAMAGEDFKAMKTFSKELSGNISKAFTKANLLQGAASLITKAIIGVDSGAGELAKSMNITYSNALKARRELTGMANATYDNAVTTKGLQESLIAVNSSLGTSGKLAENDLVIFTKLREQAGLTNEELVSIQKYTMATGGELKDNVASFQAAAKIMSYQRGIAVNTKALMTDIANVSNQTKLSIEGGAEGLARAMVSAKLLGSDLEKVANIADQLLQFETSIENELSAELLVGRDITLEKARQAALNNDLATLSDEIAKQAGSAAEFSNMNRIQQEAIAKAVGMTADQLADTLVEQEALKAVGRALNDEEQRAFETAKQKYGLEEASKMLRNGQIDQLTQQQSIQERFNQAILKFQEIFVGIANVIMPVLDAFSGILNVVGKIVGFMGDWAKYIVMIVAGVKAYNFLTKDIGKNTIAINVAKKVGLVTDTQASFLAKARTYEENKRLGLNKTNQIYEKASLLTMVRKSAAAKLTAWYENSVIKSLIKQISLQTKNLAKAVATAAAWAVANPVQALLGAGIAATVAAGIYSLAQGDDVLSPGGNSSGYGNRVLLAPEGAIQLNNKDNIIATTNPINADDMMSAPKGTLSVSNSMMGNSPRKNPNAGLEAKLDKLIAVTGKVNAIPTFKIQ